MSAAHDKMTIVGDHEPKVIAHIRKGHVDKAPGLALRTLLWEPLARALPPKTERLVIAPDGALALLPFEALTPYVREVSNPVR